MTKEEPLQGIRVDDPRAVELYHKVETIAARYGPTEEKKAGFEALVSEYGGQVVSRNWGCSRSHSHGEDAISYGFHYPDWAVTQEVLDGRARASAFMREVFKNARPVESALFEKTEMKLEPMAMPTLESLWK